MSALASTGSPKRAYSTSNRADGSNEVATDDEAQHPKKRTKRAICACERCRIKKLRCTGGQPCSACRRANADCDFDDLNLDHEQQSSITTDRLSRLERTVTDLVSGLSHLTQQQQPTENASTLPATRSFNVVQRPPQNAATSADSGNPREPLPPTSRSVNASSIESPSPNSGVAGRGLLASPNTFAAQPRGNSVMSAPLHNSPLSPQVSERVDSRWAALQHSSAPFPPLMSHPTAWSEQPAKTSPDGDPTAQPALGMTHYKAQVKLESDPINEGLVDEVGARALFNLFFQRCHPSFPLICSYGDESTSFEMLRASSPFLFTVVLAIASRYYSGFRETQTATPNLPVIDPKIFASLIELAYAHLGFALFRKQHQLEDVQAVLLLSAWILRGSGQSPDQWMVTGLCTRLAYRIGVPYALTSPAVAHLLNSTHLDPDDVQEVNGMLPQWHTWLMINQYDTFMSLGFGRPHTAAFAQTNWQQYLPVVRKLGSLTSVNSQAATYVTSLSELSTIASDFISTLRTVRSLQTDHQNTTQPAAVVRSKFLSLLSELNPRLDTWQRRWTWSGSYDTITLGIYGNLVKIYGEHMRLCLNSLSLNLITVDAADSVNDNILPAPYLTKACEAAMTLVQYYAHSADRESIVRYGGEYLVLTLGQTAMFIVRILVARLEEPMPVERLALEHYLKQAIEALEANDLSTTNICPWLAGIVRDLAHHAGLDIESAQKDSSLEVLDFTTAELDWDFDIGVLLGQNVPAGETGVDLGHYFDFTLS